MDNTQEKEKRPTLTIKTVKKKPISLQANVPPEGAAPSSDTTAIPEADGAPAPVHAAHAAHAPAPVVKQKSYVLAGIFGIFIFLMFVAILILQWLEWDYYKLPNPRCAFPVFAGRLPPSSTVSTPAPSTTPEPAAEPVEATTPAADSSAAPAATTP